MSFMTLPSPYDQDQARKNPRTTDDGAGTAPDNPADARMAQILDAALRVFSDKAYAAARIEDIGAVAQLSEGASTRTSAARGRSSRRY